MGQGVQQMWVIALLALLALQAVVAFPFGHGQGNKKEQLAGKQGSIGLGDKVSSRTASARMRRPGGGKFAMAVEQMASDGKDLTNAIEGYLDWFEARQEEMAQRMPESMQATAQQYLEQQKGADMSLPEIQKFLDSNPDLKKRLLATLVDSEDDLKADQPSDTAAHGHDEL